MKPQYAGSLLIYDGQMVSILKHEASTYRFSINFCGQRVIILKHEASAYRFSINLYH